MKSFWKLLPFFRPQWKLLLGSAILAIPLSAVRFSPAPIQDADRQALNPRDFLPDLDEAEYWTLVYDEDHASTEEELVNELGVVLGSK